MGPLIGLGIGFLTDLIGKFGEPLVAKGIEKITGIDVTKQELTQEQKQLIVDSEFKFKQLDFEKMKLELEGKLQNSKMILDDKADARNREKTITSATGKRDYALIVLAAVIVIGFFSGLISLVFVTLDKGSGTYELLYMMFGALVIKFGTVVDYFFGSSEQK